jgi:high affinity Mn2+ porin
MTASTELARPFALAGLALVLLAGPAIADPDPVDPDQPAEPEEWSLHGQFTNVTQYHPSFSSPFQGPNSLNPGNRGDETNSATLFAGIRIGDTLELYADPEIDQGFGLSDTLGIADFTSGEAYKVGAALPYIRLPSAFGRYVIGLGGETVTDAPDQNQLGGSHPADNIILTFGKFSVTTIFDTNAYAHDPRGGDFLNWAIIDAGAFDYAADAWGYTYGGAAEWTQSWWTLRAGVFDLSRQPNDKQLVRGFGEFSTITEFEIRQDWLGAPGKIKFLGYEDTGNMADYNDAVRASLSTDAPPDLALVRKYRTKPGAEFNAEQQILPDLGAFLRASLDDGHIESYEFSDINRSVSGGLSLKGSRWDRPDDTIGLAGVISGVSSDARNFLAAGGLGILVGDGRLPKYDSEQVLELYYNVALTEGVGVGLDYQHVENPGYDALRGPADVLAFRVHGQF